MTFTRRGIAEFMCKRRSFITWRKKLKRDKIKWFFYNDYRDKYNISTFFSGKNLEYCNCPMYNIVVGDYKLGVKYVNENGTFYMFLSANSYGAYPQEVAIGKSIDGKIYLIRELFPYFQNQLTFIEIPEEYINRNEKGFKPKSYNHSIMVIPSNFEHDMEAITDEDVKCLKIAYDGIRAFSKLIEEACF